ncbi:hypothetical protein ACGFZQ_34545 [Streptomyces sp. NPDC048254]|uniref:hypothetical protein n=1 Tax=Streptomyces sp. NPDC048254 TaxID=3365525 RepID=UPI0037123A6B
MTMQCLLGKAGRTAVDRARVIDPRTVTPQRLPTFVSLVVQPGAELRRRGQAARAVTLTLRFPGGPALGKPRRLAEPSGHGDDRRQPTYQLTDGAGLQRGRLTGLALRGEDLVESGQVAEQLSLDAARRARLTAEGRPTGSGRGSDPA